MTEIRQGVLERNSFKMIYLYNELASLREKLSELEGKEAGALGQSAGRSQTKASSAAKIADRALARRHNVVHVFSICPAPELKIGTTEFWKTTEAGEAFRFMYEVTKNELKRFTHLVSSNQIRMALVSPAKVGSEIAQETVLESTPDEESYFDNAKPILKQTDSTAYYVTYFRDF